jgi:hypothetical protein
MTPPPMAKAFVRERGTRYFAQALLATGGGVTLVPLIVFHYCFPYKRYNEGR